MHYLFDKVFQPIHSFFSDRKFFESVVQKLDEPESIDNVHLFPYQAFYVIDYAHKEVIYAKGVKDVLGYDDQSFDMLKLASCYVPDEIEFISTIVMEAIRYIGQNVETLDPSKYKIMTKHRFIKKDGTEIWVNRQTAFWKVDLDERRVMFQHIFSQIPDPVKKGKASWHFEHPDCGMIRLGVMPSLDKYSLTKREKEVLGLFSQGKPWVTIADELNVSSNTVYNHKKNLMEKLGLNSSNELKEFVIKNPWLHDALNNLKD